MGIFDKAKDALGDNPTRSRAASTRPLTSRTTAPAVPTDQISSGADLAKERVADYLESPDEAESTANRPDPAHRQQAHRNRPTDCSGLRPRVESGGSGVPRVSRRGCGPEQTARVRPRHPG